LGKLVAMAYSSSLFANLADHTYVACGTGAVTWKCWGGNANGNEIGSAEGSTARADSIAQPDQKANICCYLVNGVCHQAANRILLPAGFIVSKARGHSISQALFGTYGRVGFAPCYAPFEQYSQVSGDLQECVQPAETLGLDAIVRDDSQKLDYQFIRGELELYARAAQLLASGIRDAVALASAIDLQVALFMHMAEFHLGPMLDLGLASNLEEVRRSIEAERSALERAFQNRELNAQEFASAFDRQITLPFQSRMANLLRRDAYQTLFGLPPEQQIILADPSIVERLEPV
jgi:hypothetical protein